MMIKSAIFKKVYLFSVILFLSFTSVASAQEIDSPMSAPIRGPQGRSGLNVEINERIPGDLYVAGKDVKIKEAVDNNLFLTALNADIEGRIYGSSFIAVANLNIRNDIDGDAYIASKDLQIEKEIDGNLIASAERILIKGRVDGNMYINAEHVYLSEKTRFKGDVEINAKKLIVHPSVRFSGEHFVVNGNKIEDFSEFESEEVIPDLSIADAVSAVSSSVSGQDLSFVSIVGVMIGIIGNAFATFVLIKLFPIKSQQIISNLKLNPKNIFANLKNSLIFIFLGVFLGLLLTISIIGWPLLFILSILSFVIIVVSKHYYIFKFGELAMDLIKLKTKNIFLQSFVGSLILTTLVVLLSFLPIIGNLLLALLSIFISLWAVGAIVRVKFESLYKVYQKK